MVWIAGKLLAALAIVLSLAFFSIPAESKDASAKASLGGYTFDYAPTVCEGFTCTMTIGGEPVVYDSTGRKVDASDAMRVDLDGLGRITASINGQLPMSLEPELMICRNANDCTNRSLTKDGVAIKQALGSEWYSNVVTSKLANRIKFAYNMTPAAKAVKALILRFNGTNPFITWDFTDLEAAGFTVKQTPSYVYVTLTEGAAWLDPSIILMNGNVTDDTRLNQDGSGGSSGADDDDGGDDDLNLNAYPGDIEMPIVRFGGINLIPTNATITNATVQLRVDTENLDAGEAYNIAVREVYQPAAFTVGGAAWTEGTQVVGAGCNIDSGTAATGTEISWVTRPNTTATMNQTILDTWVATDGSTATGWHVWNVTQAVQRAFAASYRNITFLFNATIASGSPLAGDCLYYASTEDATAAYRPMMNITYEWLPTTWALNQTNSTAAGTNIKHSVNWTAPVGIGLSSYIFQFCNGTWNGTHCPKRGDMYRKITLQTSGTENLADLRYDEVTTDDTGSQIKWNMSAIPAGLNIVDVKLCLNIYAIYNAPDNDVYVARVTSQTWNEASSAATINGLSETNTSNGIWNSTTSGTFACTNVTNIILTDYAAGNVNSTVRFEDVDFPVGTIDTVGVDEYLWAGDDVGVTAYAFNAREHLTTANRPKLEVMYIEEDVWMDDYGWVNDSAVAFGAGTWSNVTKAVNETVGANVAWRVYANNSGNIWTATDLFNYTLTALNAVINYVTFNDTIYFHDPVVRNVSIRFGMADVVSFKDPFPRNWTAFRAYASIITLRDLFHRNASMRSVFADVVSFVDGSAVVKGFVRSFADVFSINDGLVRNATVRFRMADTISFKDLFPRNASVRFSMSDILTLTDAFARNASMHLSIADVVTFAEGDAMQRGYVRTFFDVFGIQDLLPRNVSSVRNLAEALTFRDLLPRIAKVSNAMADILNINDRRPRVYKSVRTFGDALRIEDAKTESQKWVRGLSENLGFTDLATRAAKFFRTYADPVSWWDWFWWVFEPELTTTTSTTTVPAQLQSCYNLDEEVQLCVTNINSKYLIINTGLYGEPIAI